MTKLSLQIFVTSVVLFGYVNVYGQFPISVNATNGFTGWTITTTSNNTSENGNFLGSSNNTIDTGGQSWGLYANSGQTVAMTYVFGATLPVGGYVEIKLSLGDIDSGGTVGFGLQNSSATNRFETYYIGFDPVNSFKLNDAGGPEDVIGANTTFANSSWSNSKFQTIRFTLLPSDTYSLEFNGVPVTNSGLTITASDIDRIRLFNFNAGSGSSKDQFFNSLVVVPEPGTVAMMILSAAGGLILWKKRRS